MCEYEIFTILTVNIKFVIKFENCNKKLHRKFFGCGSFSLIFINEYCAVVRAKPRIPSPHSFLALQKLMKVKLHANNE